MRRSRNNCAGTVAVLAVILAMAALSACGSSPDGAIDQEEMAELMADIHMADSYLDTHNDEFESDSSRQAFKQAIFARHNVTIEQFDSSMTWYGHHLDKFMDVCDRTIAILEKRLITVGTRGTSSIAVSVAGDSADVWSPRPRFVAVEPDMPMPFMTFSIEPDDNSQPGDNYTWSTKLLGNRDGLSRWQMVAVYDDGTIESVGLPMQAEGWNSIRLATDSSKVLTRVYGTIEFRPDMVRTMWADSLKLVRTRINDEAYNQRYRQRVIHP